MAKIKNLQSWLDYFSMLQTYEENGFLEINPEKHEVYVTQPALYNLAGFDETGDILEERFRLLRSLAQVMRRLRAYAAFKSRHGYDYFRLPFAVHIVKADAPHDLLHTVLLSVRRPWWRLWLPSDKYEIISYD
jgi:hypothetical protein